MVQSASASQFCEYFGNIHMHTTHSDGFGSFDDLIEGALAGGLDFVFVTDHNVFVREEEEGYRRGILTLVGQEVHDPERQPAGNHLLCLGVESDVSELASDPQKLIDAVSQQNALSFLAHPIEVTTDLFPSSYPWHNWEVSGFHGVELWNYLSGFRSYTTSYLKTILVAFFPRFFPVGPLPDMLDKWDELSRQRPVVALGGTDVHSIKYSLGPVTRRFLTYEECAKGLNTHILTESPLLGPPQGGPAGWDSPNTRRDRAAVLDALRNGHCWIGYDLAGATAGFRFWAGTIDNEQWNPILHEGGQNESVPVAIMGDSISLAESQSLRLQIKSPEIADIRLLRNGRVIAQGLSDTLSYQARDAGVYRVEVWKHRWGKPRGWIFSNPIYVHSDQTKS